MSFYSQILPLTQKFEIQKRVPLHPYFTSQPYSLIQNYIKHFCAPGDVVLDLFGGSGTTLRESLLEGYKGIHVDLLPWSCFIAKVSTYKPEQLNNFERAFEKLKELCEKDIQALYKLSKKDSEKLKDPKGFPSKVILPKNSDVETLGELFTQRNKAALWKLLSAIKSEKNESLRDFFLFVYSGILARASKTYWKDKEGKGGGDSGIYKVYRYWIPPTPDERNVWELFEARVFRVAKLISQDNNNKMPEPKIICGSATDVTNKIGASSVDYIFTDPPYAKHITYLDLSTIYHALLDFPVTDKMREKEAIEGGDNAKTQDEYFQLMTESFRTAFNVLKNNRWMTVVFTHKDPDVFAKIIKSATSVGFQFVNAVSQDTKRPSFHKINNSMTVIKGQMMLNFIKTPAQKTKSIRPSSDELRQSILNSATNTIQSHKGAATFSQVVHDLYENLLSQGFIQNFSEDLKNLQQLLDTEFQRKLSKNEYVYFLKAKETDLVSA